MRYGLEGAGETRTGRRQNNQDQLLVEPRLGLFAVADGMGGYEGGEVASGLAVDALREFFSRRLADPEATWPLRPDPRLVEPESLLDVAVRAADQAIRERREGRLASMGSTVAAILVVAGSAVVGHVGDSRVYLARAGALRRLTRDHSFYEQLLAQGARDLPPPERFPYQHVITRALGMPGLNRPELRVEPIAPGDVLLLCSDGLSGALDEAALAAGLGAPSAAEACRALVEAAFRAGSRDNITAVVVRLRPPGDRTGRAGV
jgi:PPM family protein phosphatase